MDHTKLKNYLEVTTNIAVLLVAVAILSVIAWSYFNRFQTVDIQAGLQRGQKFYQPPVAPNGNVEQTFTCCDEYYLSLL